MIINILFLIILLICVDSIWLYLIKDKYSDMIQSITYSKMNLNIYYGIVTYVLLAIGLYYLALNNNENNMKDILVKAFLVGLVSYGVYDATNASIFEKWNIGLAVGDTLWGSVLCVIVAYVYVTINKKMLANNNK